MITRNSYRKSILLLFVITCIVVSPTYSEIKVAAADPGPFFSISLLASGTGPGRTQWATLMAEQLPRIGIAIDVVDYTFWNTISNRTWYYPGPYPIPTYAEGGYDILFLEWSWGLDWDPTGFYDSSSITPNGDNFYQYSSAAMDNALGNYTSSFILADRIEYCKEIQAILYEDNPSIPIVYPLSVYPHVDTLVNFNGLLWGAEQYPFHGISNITDGEFHYASPTNFDVFHPFFDNSIYDRQWLRQIYNGLAMRDPSLFNGYGPWIAESYSSSDGLTYNIVIKDEACWADGTDLTTDDIIYNYQLAVTPALGSADYSTNILYWDNVSITKINDKEFSIEFLKSYIFQDGNLALDLIPKHIWEFVNPEDHQTQASAWADNSPEKLFGAGPYMLEDFDSTNDIIHLTKNDHFKNWSGVDPSINDIYFKSYDSKDDALAALAAGTIDMVDPSYQPQLDELDLAGVTYTLVENGRVYDMAINMEHPYLGTGELCPIAGEESAKHIRKAISYMVPREVICDDILNGLAMPASTTCPNVAVGWDSTLEPYDYNIDKALYHMTQAGMPTGWTNTTTLPPNTSITLGIEMSIILGIFSLVGATILIIDKRRR